MTAQTTASVSKSVIAYHFSVGDNAQLAYATVWSLRSWCSCNKIAPRPTMLAGQIAFKQLKEHLVSSPVLCYPSFDKHFIIETDAGTEVTMWNWLLSFTVVVQSAQIFRLIDDSRMSNLHTNWWTSLPYVGTGKLLTAETHVGFGLISSGVITWPKYSMSWCMKWHFDGLNLSPVSAKHWIIWEYQTSVMVGLKSWAC